MGGPKGRRPTFVKTVAHASASVMAGLSGIGDLGMVESTPSNTDATAYGIGRGIAVLGIWGAVACIAIFANASFDGWVIFAGIFATMCVSE